MVKDSSRKRHFFANTMQNRQLASLKRTPINNRKDTPSIPVQGLRAQGKRNQNAFWRFKIFGTLVITFVFVFLQFIKENQVTQSWRRGGGAHTRDSKGGLEKLKHFFSLFFFFFLFLSDIENVLLELTWATSFTATKKTQAVPFIS